MNIKSHIYTIHFVKLSILRKYRIYCLKISFSFLESIKNYFRPISVTRDGFNKFTILSIELKLTNQLLPYDDVIDSFATKKKQDKRQ